jgi:hypothetical protein
MLGNLGSPDFVVLYLVALVILAPIKFLEFDKSFGTAIEWLEEGSMALRRLLLMPLLRIGPAANYEKS